MLVRVSFFYIYIEWNLVNCTCYPSSVHVWNLEMKRYKQAQIFTWKQQGSWTLLLNYFQLSKCFKPHPIAPGGCVRNSNESSENTGTRFKKGTGQPGNAVGCLLSLTLSNYYSALYTKKTTWKKWKSGKSQANTR